MRRKILQHFANMLCQILVGWRMGDDLLIIRCLDSGIIEIDILQEKCSNNGKMVDGLHIVGELHAWLTTQLQTNNIPQSGIINSGIKAEIEINIIKKKRGVPCTVLKWDIVSVIQTDEKKYEGRLTEVTSWIGD